MIRIGNFVDIHDGIVFSTFTTIHRYVREQVYANTGDKLHRMFIVELQTEINRGVRAMVEAESELA